MAAGKLGHINAALVPCRYCRLASFRILVTLPFLPPHYANRDDAGGGGAGSDRLWSETIEKAKLRNRTHLGAQLSLVGTLDTSRIRRRVLEMGTARTQSNDRYVPLSRSCPREPSPSRHTPFQPNPLQKNPQTNWPFIR